MNILFDSLPESVIVKKVKYCINWNAGTLIKIMCDIEKKTHDENFIYGVLKSFYCEIPPDLHEAVRIFTEFCKCTYGSNKINSREKHDGRHNKSSYSFSHDANLIYAAFVQQYSIKDPWNLHWYVFMALFEGLTDECLFVKVLKVRNMAISKSMSIEEKNYWRKLKQTVALNVAVHEEGFADNLWRI